VVRPAGEFFPRAGRGLCGACLAAADNNWNVLVWSIPNHQHWWLSKGILWKVVVPMISSPILDWCSVFVHGASIFVAQLASNHRQQNLRQTSVVQLGLHGFSHGTNDAQKPWASSRWHVGGTSSGAFDHLPGWLFFCGPLQPKQTSR